MTLGVCMCTCGPPVGGRCAACGAMGPPYYPQPIPVAPQHGVVYVREVGPSADDIRKIVREEIERAKEEGE